jgi:hypothetical protein
MCFLTSCSGQSGAQKKLTGVETQAATYGLTQAQQTIPQATSALQAPLNFFQSLLSGNRNEIMSALSPSISTLSSEYDTGRKTAQEFAPRGGGRAAALEEEPFQEASQIESLVQGAQTEGAQGVASIASELADIGLGEMGVSSTTASNAFNQIQTAKEDVQSEGASAGSAVGSLIALLAA